MNVLGVWRHDESIHFSIPKRDSSHERKKLIFETQGLRNLQIFERKINYNPICIEGLWSLEQSHV